jgi:hypothetical protein
MAVIVCLWCGKRRVVSECRTHLMYCCVACFRASQQPDPVAVASLGRRGLTQREAAEVIGISYPQFRRWVKSLGLRDMFPANGAAASFAVSLR